MDEPFAALDEITRFKLNNDLLTLWQSLRRTVIFVTHSVFESVYLSQRIVVMTPRPSRVFATSESRRLTRATSASVPRPILPAIAAPSPKRSAKRWEARHERARAARRLAILVLALVLLVWDLVVRAFAIPLTCCRVPVWC